MGFIAKAVGGAFKAVGNIFSPSKPKRQAPPVQPIQQAISPEPIVRKQATQAAKSGVIRLAYSPLGEPLASKMKNSTFKRLCLEDNGTC